MGQGQLLIEYCTERSRVFLFSGHIVVVGWLVGWLLVLVLVFRVVVVVVVVVAAFVLGLLFLYSA